jgi:small GTP-binding protein
MSSIDCSENDCFSDLAEDEVDVRTLYKIVFLGNSGVGKTNIMHRFTTNSFNINTKPTIGVDFAIKTISVDDTFVKLQLWDTAGQERYQTYTSAYFKDALGIIIVYDITSQESFKAVRRWMEIASDHVQLQSCCFLLLGNKTDLEATRQVSTFEAQEYATKNGLIFMETSAFEAKNPNVFRAIKMLVRGRLRRDHDQERGG